MTCSIQAWPYNFSNWKSGAVIDYAKIASIVNIDLIKDLKKLILYENVFYKKSS